MLEMTFDEGMGSDLNNKNILYKQCKFKRGNTYWTAWMPSPLAKIGKLIIPKDEEPATVEEVFSTTLTHEQVMAAGGFHLTHHIGSDI
jgi:hypothetical protein